MIYIGERKSRHRLVPILIIALGAMMSTAASAAPLCLRVDTGKMVRCFDDSKIDAALAIIKRRGGDADRDFVISIEMNRGKFSNAAALARYILGEGER